MNITVAKAGFLMSVQDLGRTGARDQGVSLSGALDLHAMRVANALVGNGDNAAGIEATFGRATLRFSDRRLVAWCGGPLDVRIGEEAIPVAHAALVQQNEELTITAAERSSRAWLAVSGGIDVPVVLGSRSTDLRAEFGGFNGRALQDGDVLPLGECHGVADRFAATARARVAPWTVQHDWVEGSTDRAFLRVVRGTNWGAFSIEAHEALVTSSFIVSPESNRMGVRLTGAILAHMAGGDLISEAVAPGTIQVPPDGQPILLLNDCQTIGGYPKIAHVITADLGVAGRLRAGDAVRFHHVSMADAHKIIAQREQDLARFRTGMMLRLR